MLKRVNLSLFQKKILEEITGLEISLKNTSKNTSKNGSNTTQNTNLDNVGGQNVEAISGLMEQAKLNASIYLGRQKLQEKLNIFEENNLFGAVVDLQKSLGLKNLPRLIECYDISHLSGKFVFGSMVVFVDGRSSKAMYKLFKTKEQNDDFANHKEVLSRRLERALGWEIQNRDTPMAGKTSNPWKLADLIIVDGGKGQLSSDYEVLKEYRQKFIDNGFELKTEICSLAKRQEEVFLPIMEEFREYRPELLVAELGLPESTQFGQQGGILLAGQTSFLVQRIRDEAHRFAITNNRNARLKQAKKSQLDDVGGIGPGTKTKLLSTFGSVENLVNNLSTNRELVYELVGVAKTKVLVKHFLGLER